MDDKLREIQDELASLKLDDSLLFLNHLLGVARGFTTDPVLGPVINKAYPPVLPHVIHFLAKQLLLHASNLGVGTMNWGRFRCLSGMCVNLDDPIQHDPNWKHADPSGFFERMLAQQITPQRRNLIQKYGLALGLFRDVGPVDWPKPYDVRADMEAELRIPLEQFMGMGHVTFALRTAKHQNNECIGTFKPMMLAEAFRKGIEFCVPEVWTPYLDRVSCTRDEFREISAAPIYNVQSHLFEQFGFNPLRRFPIINLGESRYLAVDPELVVERVTLGLFYDLFERDRTQFSERFGYAFEQFIGQLLGSVCPSDRLWSAAEWERTTGQSKRQSLKLGDWAYVGDSCTVLLECKSLRPTLELTTYGSDRSLVDLTRRVAAALEQLIGHTQGINDGKWEQSGLSKAPTVGVIVTYGKFYTVNGPFARKCIRKSIIDSGKIAIPFIVLSLDELDTALRLVETGHSFDTLIQSLASDEDSFDPLHKYHEELRERAVSSFTFAKGEEFMERVIRRSKLAAS